MKRSEMVQAIANEIRCMVEMGGMGYLGIAEEIVTLIENKGMKPPIKKRCTILLTDKHVWQDEEA